MKKIILITTFCALLFSACKEEPVLPYNPYDDIVYPVDEVPVDTLGAHSLTRVHKEVFDPKCNVLGCHDGHFEPDYRSPQSTYSTMVYHPIVKNNLAEEFTYRVVPGDTAASVLWERLTNCCFVNQNDRMPQDNIGISMPQSAIDQIGGWIMAGAPDIFGANRAEPNSLPNIHYFTAMNSSYDTSYQDNRVDDLFYNPFILPMDSTINFIFLVDDDLTEREDLLVNTLKISTDIDDFSAAQSFSANGIDAGQFGYLWVVTLNSNIFSSSQQYFMRYYCNDGENADNAEYPETEDASYYKSMWSFIVQ
jgi:hypothetical protein